jgi:hypothetical protein
LIPLPISQSRCSHGNKSTMSPGDHLGRKP